MELLEAGREDVPGIQRVARDTWRAAYVDILGRETVEDVLDDDAFYATDTLESVILSPDTELFVAREDRGVYGFIGLSWTDALRNATDHLHETAAEITMLSVHPSKTRLGIGTDLFETATRSLPDDVTELYVRYLTENAAAQGFYDSLGFDRVDTSVSAIDGHDHEVTLAKNQR